MLTANTIKKQARLLAREHHEADPQLKHVYWFPDDQAVYLIGLNESVPIADDGIVHPFYFAASPEDQMPAPSGVALIRPDEFGRLMLPKKWGDWKTAVELPLDGNHK